MGSGLLEVDPAGYRAASMTVGRGVGDAVRSAFDALASRRDVAGMAGSDPAGAQWAAQFDAAARALASGFSVVWTGCLKLADLLEHTGFNYGMAESSSDPRRLVPIPPDPSVYSASVAGFDTPPSAVGAGQLAPGAWSLISGLVGRVWPNGHQDRLRAVAGALRWQAVPALIRAADLVPDAVTAIRAQRAPEVDDAVTACAGLDRHLVDLQDVCIRLADACEGYAARLDGVHSAVEHELVSLGWQSAAIETASALLAPFTFGGSAAAGQVVEGSRLAAIAARIAALIDDFAAAAWSLGDAFPIVIGRLDALGAELEPLLSARVLRAAMESAPEERSAASSAEIAASARLEKTAVQYISPGERPAVRFPRRQLEAKFKHAPAFGIRTERSVQSFQDYESALRQFLDDPTTMTILGECRGSPALLSYQQSTRLVVICDRGGEFISGWRLRDNQFQRLIATGRLGLG